MRFYLWHPYYEFSVGESFDWVYITKCCVVIAEIDSINNSTMCVNIWWNIFRVPRCDFEIYEIYWWKDDLHNNMCLTTQKLICHRQNDMATLKRLTGSMAGLLFAILKRFYEWIAIFRAFLSVFSPVFATNDYIIISK